MAQENKNVPVMDISEQKQIRIDKLKELQSRGKDPFEITRFEPTAYSEDIKANYEEYEGKTVTIAGRVMSKRIMGKAAFCHIQDKQGKMQVYVKREDVKAFYIPATRIANELGIPTLANMIILGKMIKETGVVKFENAVEAMKKVVSAKRQDLLDLNIKALKTGFDY